MEINRNYVIPISFGMVNVFLIKGKKTILIDTGYHGTQNRLINKMKNHGIEPKDIGLVIITHGHNDHYGSAKEIKALTGAKILIHKNDVDNLRKGINGELKPTKKIIKFMSKFLSSQGNAEKYGLEPDIVIDDKYNLQDYGINGEVIPTPGHTAGSVSVVLENGEAIVGDLMMAFLPWQKPGYPMYADDIDQ